MLKKLVAIFVISLAAVGCAKPKPAASTKVVAHIEALTSSLPSDREKAGAVLVSRLTESLTRSGNLLVVQDKGFVGTIDSTYVMPSAAAWTVECGIVGVDVTFGNTISAGVDGGGGNDVILTLSMAPEKDPQRCAYLAALVGRALEKVTSEP